MRQSALFAKTQKEIGKDIKSTNAQLLIKAGFVNQLAAGIYIFLHLGLRTIYKIEDIIRQEMNATGASEVLMPALHPKKNWEQTKRWQEDVMFKIKSITKQEYGLGWTHEEIVTPLAQNFLSSYKDLPVSVYQIQTKFRDEKRAKSGVLRGREFRMKDMYSFHLDQASLDKYYEKVKQAYFNVFKRVGLDDVTYLTFASGGAFSKFSHEFQTVSPEGEDEIHLCTECQVAINKEIVNEQKTCPECGAKDFEIRQAIEVGNIFKLKDRFSKAFNLKIKDKAGKEVCPLMGCYGLGSSRLLGTVAELLSDKQGLVWPEEIAPFKYHLLLLSEEPKDMADKIHQELGNDNVLLDDRQDVSAGQKLAEADLIGLPYRLVVGKKTGDKIELKKRTESDSKLVELGDLKNI